MSIQSENKKPLKASAETASQSSATCASVNAGICGFTCRIKAWKIDKSAVGVEICESECQQIQQFAEILSKLTMREIFAPLTRNPVYLAAEQSGCHPSCPVPAAVLKTAEVALEMALARDALIQFEPCQAEAV